MNTIIVNEADIDTKKYDGCKSPFMFDNFNLIVNTNDSKKIHIKVRNNTHGIMVKFDDDFFIGMRVEENIKDIYPNFPKRDVMTVVEYDDGDIGVGEFLISNNLSSAYEVMKITELLSTEKGYKKYHYMHQWLCNIMCVIMMMGKEERKRKLIKSSHGFDNNNSNKNNDRKPKDNVFLLDDIVNYISDNYIPEGGHHNILCPCWEVRGHYRHYKSGKVIFIPSYRKGKDKDTTQPKSKTYIAGGNN